MRVLVFDGLRDLTSHPHSLSPLRGEGIAMGHRHYFGVLRHTTLLRFMGGEPVQMEPGTFREPAEKSSRVLLR